MPSLHDQQDKEPEMPNITIHFRIPWANVAICGASADDLIETDSTANTTCLHCLAIINEINRLQGPIPNRDENECDV